ncbi:MAG: hypothetical protein QHG99_03990 [Methanomicrobiales archaeon]|nr:hypothetical protein [Methanomicrobiales archaeon]
MVNLVSQRAVDSLFHAFFALTDIRAILRSTAPAHELNESEQERVRVLLEEMGRQLGVLKEELLR